MSMTPEVEVMVSALLSGAQEALPGNVVGFYLRGSLALGDFEADTSDLDFLVVTERPVSEVEFEVLGHMHAQLAAMPNKYAHHMEGSYIDRASLKAFAPGERRHVTIGVDWPLKWAEHRANWILERWVLREHGIALLGPDASTLIDPISPEEIKDAVRGELEARMQDWASTHEGPDWLLPRNYQAFEIETMCRALCTLATGELRTKPKAVEWALEMLSEPWHGLVVWSQQNRADETKDATMIPNVKDFIRWAARESLSWPSP